MYFKKRTLKNMTKEEENANDLSSCTKKFEMARENETD